MTYSQKANPDATNSELDAKVIIKQQPELTKEEEDEIIEDLMKEVG